MIEVREHRDDIVKILKPYADIIDITKLGPALMPIILTVTSVIIEDLINEGKLKLC